MRRGIFYYIIISVVSVVIVFFNYNTAFAADAMCRLMHNDHDALVLGEVIEVSENEITIDVENQIISSKDLNVASPRKQISIEGIVTIGGIKEYAFFNGTNSIESSPQNGDYVLVSVIKKGDSFINAWGVFKVDSKDYRTLNILYPKEASRHTKMDVAAIKAFINSNGTKNDFSFDGNTGKVYSNGEVIYGENVESNENIVDGDVTTSSFIDTNEKEIKNNVISSSSEDKLMLVIIGIILIIVIIGAYVIKNKKSSRK